MTGPPGLARRFWNSDGEGNLTGDLIPPKCYGKLAGCPVIGQRCHMDDVTGEPMEGIADYHGLSISAGTSKMRTSRLVATASRRLSGCQSTPVTPPVGSLIRPESFSAEPGYGNECRFRTPAFFVSTEGDMGISWSKHNNQETWWLEIAIGGNRFQVLFGTELLADEFIAAELTAGERRFLPDQLFITANPHTAAVEIGSGREAIGPK
jgi:hypothetical protein